MRWVCILFPQLALDAVLRQRPEPDEPLVLLSGPAQRRVLQAVNGAARKLGLRPGQSMTATSNRSAPPSALASKVAIASVSRSTRAGLPARCFSRSLIRSPSHGGRREPKGRAALVCATS